MKKMCILLALLAWCLPVLAGYRVVEGVLSHSDIYPGTVHGFVVTVPEGEPATEFALCVGLDGRLCRAPEVIDSLSALGVVPPMVGVWLQPGRVVDTDGTVLRYNRSNEFDAIDGRFARFLECELLPSALKQAGVRVSDKPADRMIMGLSSGGIAALVAAWQRPDLFARVFSGVGTFVAMRGGNDVQALVRKTEPPALRVFLQDGSADVWNALFGHWYEGNRMLATALEFAGIQSSFDWGEGGHNVVGATRVFPEALAWLWSEAPARGTTHNDMLQHYLTGDDWHEVKATPAAGMAATVAFYPDSTLMVQWHEGDNNLWQLVRLPDGSYGHAQRFYWLHNVENKPLEVTAMEFDSLGNLFVATDIGIQVCDHNGRVRAIIRYPQGVERVTRLSIDDGAVTVTNGRGVWSRRLNVRPAVPGVRPASQGQG